MFLKLLISAVNNEQAHPSPTGPTPRPKAGRALQTLHWYYVGAKIATKRLSHNRDAALDTKQQKEIAKILELPLNFLQ